MQVRIEKPTEKLTPILQLMENCVITEEQKMRWKTANLFHGGREVLNIMLKNKQKNSQNKPPIELLCDL